jgi:hypothetical protein
LAILVLVILAVLWAVVLVPPLLRSRSEARRSDSVGDFNYRLGVLSKTGGHMRTAPRAPRQDPYASASRGMSRAQRRRRDVLLVLTFIAVLTVGLAAGTGSTMLWAAQLFADALLVVYVLAIIRMRSLATDRRAKVAYLPNRARPELMLRRTGSS